MIWGQVIAAYQADIDALQQEHALLGQEIGPRLTAYGERIQSLWQAIKSDLRVSVLSVQDYPVPVSLEVQELGSGLYNSAWDYMSQLEVYKQFQGRA